MKQDAIIRNSAFFTNQTDNIVTQTIVSAFYTNT